MVTGQLTTFLRLLVGRKIDGSDRQLLERFVADADEVAFAALVDRHGGLVFGVCRSVLRHEQDAEDAFQATFLVLARLASSIRKRDSLASWLHGVALRTALKARRAMARCRRSEQQASVPSQQEPVSEAALREVQTILHEEIERLPDKYRAPFVLCCLEGKSRAEAAQQLGWKEGTVSGRIAQARSLLEGRLARRGVALPAALAAAVLLQAPAKAAVSIVVRAALDFAAGGVSETLSPFAATLAQGVIQAMLVTKLKTIAAVALVLAVVLAGGGWLAYAAWQPEERNPAKGAPPPNLAVKAPQQPKPPADAPAPPRSEQPQAGKPAPPRSDPTPEDDSSLPPPAVKRMGSLKWQFFSPVLDLVFSGDGKWLLTGDGNTIRLYDPATGQEIRSFEASDNGIRSLFLAADGQVAVSGGDQRIQIWDTATGKQVRSYSGDFVNLCGSADGKILAGLGHLAIFGIPKLAMPSKMPSPPEPKVRVWNAATREPLKQFADGIEGACGVALAPDGKTLAWTTSSDTMHVVNVADGKERFKVDALVIGAFAFSPDSKLLAYGSREGLMLVDAADGKEARKCPRRQPIKKADYLRKIAFAPAGDKVVAFCNDESFGVWDVGTGKETARFEGPPTRGETFAISPDGKTIAAPSGRTIAFHDIATGKRRIYQPVQYGFLYGTAISPDGQTIATASWEEKEIRLWNRATGQVRLTIDDKPGSSIDTLAFSPDSTTLIALRSLAVGDAPKESSGIPTMIANSFEFRPFFWDVQTGKEKQRDQSRTFKVERASAGPVAAISPDGKTIAAGGVKGGIICLWDLPSGKPSRLQVSGKGWVESVAFSADGKKLVAGTCDGSVYVLDLTTHKELCRIHAHDQSVNLVALSPDGKRVAGHGYNDQGWFSVWDADTGKEINNYHFGVGGLTALAFAPDGKTLALASLRRHLEAPEYNPQARIHLFDAKTMQKVRILEGHLQEITSLSFSADSRLLVSGSRDGTALIWDLSKTERRDP